MNKSSSGVCVGAVVPISVEISAEARESVVAPIAAACCPPGVHGRRWRDPKVALDDACHNLFITKKLAAAITVELIHAELMEATVREMPRLVDSEALEATDNKSNSNYEEPLASAQRKRWLNSIDFNPAGPFCYLARR